MADDPPLEKISKGPSARKRETARRGAEPLIPQAAKVVDSLIARTLGFKLCKMVIRINVAYVEFN
jgi:hypothetical protein